MSPPDQFSLSPDKGYSQAEAALAGAAADGGYDEFAGDEEVPF